MNLYAILITVCCCFDLLIIVFSEPVELNSMSTEREPPRYTRYQQNNAPTSLLPSLVDDVAETKTKSIELENRLKELESRYEAMIENHDVTLRRLAAQEALNLQQKRLVAKLKRIVGSPSSRRDQVDLSGLAAGFNPSIVASPSGGTRDGTVRTKDIGGDDDDGGEQAPLSADVDGELEDDLLQINEYLGNREAEFVALNPNGDELVAASADDFDRVSSNPSLYGKALLHLDERNEELTERFEDLMRSVEEFKSQAKSSLTEARRRNNGFGVSSHVTGSLTDNERIVTMLEDEKEREGEEDEDVVAVASKTKKEKVSGKCAFSVASSTSQLGIQDVPQSVQFDYTFSNKGDGFKMENNSFVCSLQGYYYFSFSLRSYDNRYIGVSLMKNDEYQVSVFTDSSERNVMESQSVTLHLEICQIMVRICAVVGCANSTKKLDDWYSKECDIHKMKLGCCICKPPFFLHAFPTELRDSGGRERWAGLLNRVGRGGETWRPTSYDRVCSFHFVDGEPTEANPDPTEHLGYESAYPQAHNGKLSRRHMLTRQLFEVVRKERREVRKRIWENVSDQRGLSDETTTKRIKSEVDREREEPVNLEEDHSYAISLPAQCRGCIERDSTIRKLKDKIRKLHQKRTSSVAKSLKNSEQK